MGSHQNTQQNQHSTSNQTSTSEVTGIAPYQQQFQQQYGQTAGMLHNAIAQPLNQTQWNGFSSTLDPIVANQVSQGVQANNVGNATAGQELANRLAVGGTGSNGALLAALNRQGAMNAAGNNNALIPAALAEQRNFDVQKQGILANQNAQNLAVHQSGVSDAMQGVNLLNTLNQMAATSAGKKVTQTGVSDSSGNSNTQKGFF